LAASFATLLAAFTALLANFVSEPKPKGILLMKSRV
jgi:hypothetical protein